MEQEIDNELVQRLQRLCMFDRAILALWVWSMRHKTGAVLIAAFGSVILTVLTVWFLSQKLPTPAAFAGGMAFALILVFIIQVIRFFRR